MLGALLLISHALCNQMLLIDQLSEHHNDHLDLKIISSLALFVKDRGVGGVYLIDKFCYA